jgi:hypothetical protein
MDHVGTYLGLFPPMSKVKEKRVSNQSPQPSPRSCAPNQGAITLPKSQLVSCSLPSHLPSTPRVELFHFPARFGSLAPPTQSQIPSYAIPQ